jgi:hypothetical protein
MFAKAHNSSVTHSGGSCTHYSHCITEHFDKYLLFTKSCALGLNKTSHALPAASLALSFGNFNLSGLVYFRECTCTEQKYLYILEC